MFESRNAHLNAFKAWNQQDVAALDDKKLGLETRRVLENNLTRALAITLERDQVFATRFAQMIERGLPATCPPLDLAGHALSDNCSVNLEVPIGNFDKGSLDASRIVPVVISAGAMPTQGDGPERTAAVRGRIDLIVRIGDYLLVVEAKRGGGSQDDAVQQLRAYMKTIVGPVDMAQVISPVCLTWQDILVEGQLLTGSHRTHRNGDTILSDFVEYLSSSASALAWEGDARPFNDLQATQVSRRDAVWRSAMSKRMEEWVRSLVGGLAGATIDESIIGQRWCVRLDWGWAREINFRIDCGNDRLVDRAEWERSEGHHVVGVEAFLTVGDTLGQMDKVPVGINPWHIDAAAWDKRAFLGLMHFQGRGVHFVSLSAEQSGHLWGAGRQMLRNYKRVEREAPPFPAAPVWNPCRQTWAQYWETGRKGFVILTARVEFHRRFPISATGLPGTASIAEAFAGLRGLFTPPN